MYRHGKSIVNTGISITQLRLIHLLHYYDDTIVGAKRIASYNGSMDM